MSRRVWKEVFVGVIYSWALLRIEAKAWLYLLHPFDVQI